LLQAAIAKTYSSLGLYQEAGVLQEKVLAYDRASLAPEHSDLIGAIFNLASYYHHAGRREEALQMREEVLVRFRKAEGPESHNTLASMANLITSYEAAGKRGEALRLREELLAIRRKKNPGAAETLEALSELADAYEAAGRTQEARVLREEEATLRREAHGLENRDARARARILIASQVEAGRFAEAEALARELIEYHHRNPTTNQLELGLSLSGLGDCQLRLGRLPDAEAVLREAVLILEKDNAGFSALYTAQSLLGATMSGQSNYAAAEPLLLQAHAGLEKRERENPSASRARHIKETCERLIHLYEAWDKPKQLAEWKQKLETFEKAEAARKSSASTGTGKP
jgi:tetratricopeptide (TPR) repeat protein